MFTLARKLRPLLPARVVAMLQLAFEVWLDLRLRIITDVGHLPSHSLRNWVYSRCGLRVPSTSALHWRAGFYAPENVVIGEFTTIGDTCFLDGRSGITIGDSVNIGSHVTIWTRQHDVDDASFTDVGAPVTVGSYAYLASHCVILPGVSIGEGAVVAAGAVVTSDVDPYTVVGGVPARFLRDRSHHLSYKLGGRKRFV